MAVSELFPRLELVPTASIKFHEQPERRRTVKLTERLQGEALLRNPPIVADMGDGAYLLLDGANRVSAFREIGYPEIPTQVVEYSDPAVELRGWHHLLLDPSALNLSDAYRQIEGVVVREVSAARLPRALEFREVFAVWVDHDARLWGLYPAGPVPSLVQRIRVLTEVIACYEHGSPLERIKLAEYEELPAVVQRQTYELCLFPSLTKEELMGLVREDWLIPTGISRHLIPGRALGLNIPLGFLTDMPDPDARQRYFREHIDQLELRGRIRYYEEPVFIMNE